MLVPTPIFAVEPTITATWPARQAANSRAFSASLRASWMNLNLVCGDAMAGELVAELLVGVPAGVLGVLRSQNTICSAPGVGERCPVSGSL